MGRIYLWILCFLISCAITAKEEVDLKVNPQVEPIGDSKKTFAIKNELIGCEDFDWVTYDFNWSKFEKRYEDDAKSSLLEKIDRQDQIALKPYLFENLESTHFIDLNKDGFDDLVYYGESGAEGLMTCIFINNQDKNFSCVFDYSAHPLCGIYQIDDRVEIVVFSEPVSECSDEYFRTFTYTTGDTKFVEDVRATILLHPKTTFPDSLYREKRNYSSKEEGCLMRYSPLINNKELGYNNLIGNVMGKIPKNTSMRVLAENVFSNGKIWCFVEVIDDSKNTFFNECQFLHKNFEKMTVYGWVHKDDLVERED